MPKVLAATPQTIAAIRKMSHIPIVMNSRGPQHIPIGGGGGGGTAGVLTVGPSGGYGVATWQPVADDLTPTGATVPVIVLPLR